MALVLASRSPRRIELLERAGLQLTVDPADIDESPRATESAEEYVARIATDKLRAVASRHPGMDVIAADTTVALDGDILGQPIDDDDARRMLGALSGRTHQVHTAVAAVVNGEVRTVSVTSAVTFATLTAARIEWYVGTGEPRGKAGAYGIQGCGIALVARVDGSLTNVIGLPVPQTLALLAR